MLERLRERDDAKLAERAERPRNVLPPRLGGPLALLEAAPEADLVLCIHAGLEDSPTVGDLLAGRLIGRTVRVRCLRVPSNETPESPAEWPLDRWEDVDAFVAAHRKPF